ncbi:MAG: prepilin-type N-terminal cleavage/methylation domain-containing protein [Clostridiales bacterium]|jgi:type IV pilus assembly protein PilA|nr:prepilin-type N-terminal cleavage/methylation domain-containing protein [Clostridiales bacterium]
MRKIGKTRKGFTLVEMVLVIAIIVIIAATIIFSVGDYLNASNAAKYSIEQHNSEIDQVYDEALDPNN